MASLYATIAKRRFKQDFLFNSLSSLCYFVITFTMHSSSFHFDDGPTFFNKVPNFVGRDKKNSTS